MEQKYFKCSHCGNIVAYVDDRGVPLICCGEKMTEIIPGAVDAATEKHLPVIKQDGNLVVVTVGEVEHPMTPEHYIEWISIATKQGHQRKILTPESKPEATFALTEGDELVAAQAYCNLHGLWKTEV